MIDANLNIPKQFSSLQWKQQSPKHVFRQRQHHLLSVSLSNFAQTVIHGATVHWQLNHIHNCFELIMHCITWKIIFMNHLILFWTFRNATFFFYFFCEKWKFIEIIPQNMEFVAVSFLLKFNWNFHIWKIYWSFGAKFNCSWIVNFQI